MRTHTVQQGECVEVVARKFGVTAAAILHAPENATLFQTRCASVLFEGDVVVVPQSEGKSALLEHDQTYTFVFRPRMQPVVLRFCRAGMPRRHEPVEWSADGGEVHETKLDDEGWFRVSVPLGTAMIRVVLNPNSDIAQVRTVRLGNLDPHVEARGVQQRLNNLGFRCGLEDGDIAEKTKAALELFQGAHNLEVTGALDASTHAMLSRRHGV